MKVPATSPKAKTPFKFKLIENINDVILDKYKFRFTVERINIKLFNHQIISLNRNCFDLLFSQIKQKNSKNISIIFSNKRSKKGQVNHKFFNF